MSKKTRRRKTAQRKTIKERQVAQPVKAEAIMPAFSETRTPKQDARMIQRAILNRWPINEEIRQKIVSQMSAIASHGESDRDRIGAARVLVSADSLNLQGEKLDLDREQFEHAKQTGSQSAISVNIENNIPAQTVSELRQQMLADSKYVEFLRHDASTDSADVDASPVRPACEPGTVEAGPASDRA